MNNLTQDEVDFVKELLTKTIYQMEEKPNIMGKAVISQCEQILTKIEVTPGEITQEDFEGKLIDQGAKYLQSTDELWEDIRKLKSEKAALIKALKEMTDAILQISEAVISPE